MDISHIDAADQRPDGFDVTANFSVCRMPDILICGHFSAEILKHVPMIVVAELIGVAPDVEKRKSCPLRLVKKAVRKLGCLLIVAGGIPEKKIYPAAFELLQTFCVTA